MDEKSRIVVLFIYFMPTGSQAAQPEEVYEMHALNWKEWMVCHLGTWHLVFLNTLMVELVTFNPCIEFFFFFV